MALLCNRVKQLREALGLTQDQLAHKSGVHKQTISRYERQTVTRFDGDTLLRLARALKVEPGFLLVVCDD